MEQKNHFIFDHFKINYDQGVFHKSGSKLNLRPKEFAVLYLLVQRNGELVTKEKIIEIVWNGTPTSDESIARCISVIKARLRAASPGADHLIKTEYGKGYRFIGKISTPSDKPKTIDKKKSVIGPPSLGEIASTQIIACSPETPISEAARLMREMRTCSILIMANSKPIGIWTCKDALDVEFREPSDLSMPISHVMQSQVISMQADSLMAEGVSLMRSRGIRHLVVLDKVGKVFGIVSQTDMVNHHGVESFMTVKDVKSVAHRNPLVIHENLSVTEIILEMRQRVTDVLIVKLEHRPMFLFTEYDVIDALANEDLTSLVGELILSPLVTVRDDTSILVARQLMDIKKISHLGVVNDHGELEKILGLSDILADIEHSYIQLIEEILEHNTVVNHDEEYTQLLTSAMQQTAGMIIITDKHGDIKYVNESFENISGYLLNEVRGKNPRFLSSGIIPKSVFQQMWQTLMSGKIWKGELCNQKKSGERYWVLSSITPIVNEHGELHHFIAVEEDITLRKEVEDRLREIEQRFYDVIDDSSIMIWESEPCGRISFLNNFWLEFTGCELHDQVGNGWAKQIHPEDLNNYLEIFQKSLIRRNSFCLDHRLKNFKGEYRWVMNSATPRFNSVGEFLGFRGTCVDITERKMREFKALNLAYWGYKPKPLSVEAKNDD